MLVGIAVICILLLVMVLYLNRSEKYLSLQEGGGVYSNRPSRQSQISVGGRLWHTLDDIDGGGYGDYPV